MEFTTEKRREMTSSVLKQNDFVDNSVEFSNNISSSMANAVDEDKTNREIFISLNSELTGYAYEYKYITGKYHPMLEETEFPYVAAEDNEFVEKTFYDSKKLQDAAALLEDNEFHLNLSEGSTVYYPEHPVKYSHWVADDHEEVSTVIPTEQNIFDIIRTVLGWYNAGGTSGLAQNLTIYNEFKTHIDGVPENKQTYMTVGFQEYTVGSSPYMSDGYNPSGDVVYINYLDPNNYSLAKIIGAKKQPSRILISPYFVKGTIPDNAIITSNHPQGDQKYILLSHELINKLEEIYKNILMYLTNNPNKGSAINVLTLANINACLDLIKTLRDGDMFNVGRLLGFVSDIEGLRVPTWTDRTVYIVDYLTTRTDLYEDRFKIIDMRLSKRMGTLREMMKIKGGVEEIYRISDEKKDQVDWFKKYFMVRRCERDGDWKRRIFIIDDNDDFNEGDEVYLLSDNESVPEIKATIDVIITARLDDQAKTKLDEVTGEVTKEYYPVKKIFFKNAWKDGEMKLIRFFSDEYKSLEGFRIIKQLEVIVPLLYNQILTLSGEEVIAILDFVKSMSGSITLNKTTSAILEIIPQFNGSMSLSGEAFIILTFEKSMSGSITLSGESDIVLLFERDSILEITLSRTITAKLEITRPTSGLMSLSGEAITSFI